MNARRPRDQDMYIYIYIDGGLSEETFQKRHRSSRNVERWPRPLNRTAFPGTRNRIATDLRQVRGVRQTAGPSAHKDAFYTLSGPRQGITHSSHGALPTRTRVEKDERRRKRRRTRGVDRGGGRAAKRRRDGYVGTSSTSHGELLFSRLAQAATFSSFSIAYHLAPHSSTVNRSM